MPGLLDFQGVEKAFHYNHVARTRVPRPIQVEQQVRFPEGGGKAVFGRLAVDRASGIGDQPSVLVANWDQTTAGKEAVAAIHPYSKQPCGGWEDATLFQIRMAGVNPLQGKTQGPIRICGSRRSRRLPHGWWIGGAPAKPVLQAQTGLPQTAALHHRHQIDHMTADPALPRRDARGGVAGPDTPRKIHGKTLATLPRGMGGKWTGAVQSMRSSGPKFHAIMGQHPIDRDALFETLEVGLWQWHGVRTASGIGRAPAPGSPAGRLRRWPVGRCVWNTRFAPW